MKQKREGENDRLMEDDKASDGKSAGKEAIRKISRGRLWLFRIVSLTIFPLLFFLIVEAGLRIFNFGYPTSFTVPCEVKGEKAYCNNDKYTWQFFPPELARTPIPFAIPEKKPPRTYRIFILGASAAQGDPMPSFGFSRILQIMLKDRYPEVSFEVVNTAVTAVNSHVVLDIARDLSGHQPDMFIVYLGNNEVVGPYGAGTVFTPLSPNLGTIRAGIFFKSTRVGQLIRKMMKSTSKERKLPKEWKGMEMFLGQQIRADAPGLSKVYGHFRRNLEDITRLARKAGINTVICTVGSNLKDSPPFASLHRRDLSDGEKEKWENIYRTGIELEMKGEYARAIERYLEAAGIDDQFADLHYRLGRSYWLLGDFEEAKKRYVLTRDLDTLRFRPDSKVNEVIRKVSEKRTGEGIYLVDSLGFFEEKSPHATPGKELFFEHVHLNIRGNYLLAKSVFDQVSEILDVHVGEVERTGLLSETECSQRLAFTSYDVFRVTEELVRRLQKAPFTNQLYHDEKIKRLQQNLETLRFYTTPKALEEQARQYLGAIEKNPEDPWLRFNYAMLLEEFRKFGGMAEELKIFIRHLPLHVPAYEKLAKALISQGKYGEAIAWCEAALKMKPDFVPVRLHMAYAFAKAGKLDESITQYREIMHLDPDMSPDIYNEIGRILLYQGKLLEAAETYREAIAFNEKSPAMKPIPDVNFNFGYVLKKAGKVGEANEQFLQAAEGYRKQLEVNPKDGETHAVLARTLLEVGDFEGATEHYRRAIDLSPTDPANHFNLIKTLKVQGNIEAAIAASREAIKIMSDNHQGEAVEAFQKELESLISRREQQR
jgi:tetratricopeptide (TPR) repeat protein